MLNLPGFVPSIFPPIPQRQRTRHLKSPNQRKIHNPVKQHQILTENVYHETIELIPPCVSPACSKEEKTLEIQTNPTVESCTFQTIQIQELASNICTPPPASIQDTQTQGQESLVLDPLHDPILGVQLDHSYHKETKQVPSANSTSTSVSATRHSTAPHILPHDSDTDATPGDILVPANTYHTQQHYEHMEVDTFVAESTVVNNDSYSTTSMDSCTQYTSSSVQATTKQVNKQCQTQITWLPKLGLRWLTPDPDACILTEDQQLILKAMVK